MNRKKVLLDAPCPELLCGLCVDILEDPIQVHCSEDHMFCGSCIADYNGSTCPSCMEPLDKSSFQPSKFVKRQISRLRVCCAHQSLGCTWEGIFENSHLHSQSCQYHSIPCPNSHNGCSDHIKQSDIDQHKSQCPYEIIPCPNGSIQCQPFLRKDTIFHDSNCSSFKCPFAHEGCSFIGTRTDINQHCENYCGKIHDRIKQLQQQCDQMKLQLHHLPETNAMDNIITDNAINDTSLIPTTTTPLTQDASLDGMTLFHQMFNNDIIPIPLENNGTHTSTPSIMNSSTDDKNNNNNNSSGSNIEMMDFSTCLPNISLPLTASISQQCQPTEDTLDTFGSRLAMAAPAPKRSSTGKIIRYSKNKHLAHGALRMARQQGSSGSNLTTEDIFLALHGSDLSGDGDISMVSLSSSSSLSSICPSSSSSASSSFPASATKIAHTTYTSVDQQQKQFSTSASPTSLSTPVPTFKPNVDSPTNKSRPIRDPTYSFKSLDDVTKFLEELPPMVTSIPSGPTTKPKVNNKTNNTRNGKLKKQNGEGCTKRSTTPTRISHSSQQQAITTNSSKPSSGSPARPMYVLASTLLSKRSQGS